MMCWHRWAKWSEPFQGVWNVNPPEILKITDDLMGRDHPTQVTMTQRRLCLKCGKGQYRKV